MCRKSKVLGEREGRVGVFWRLDDFPLKETWPWCKASSCDSERWALSVTDVQVQEQDPDFSPRSSHTRSEMKAAFLVRRRGEGGGESSRQRERENGGFFFKSWPFDVLKAKGLTGKLFAFTCFPRSSRNRRRGRRMPNWSQNSVKALTTTRSEVSESVWGIWRVTAASIQPDSSEENVQRLIWRRGSFTEPESYSKAFAVSSLTWARVFILKCGPH